MKPKYVLDEIHITSHSWRRFLFLHRKSRNGSVSFTRCCLFLLVLIVGVVSTFLLHPDESCLNFSLCLGKFEAAIAALIPPLLRAQAFTVCHSFFLFGTPLDALTVTLIKCNNRSSSRYDFLDERALVHNVLQISLSALTPFSLASCSVTSVIFFALLSTLQHWNA